jgi:UDP-N-acetylglucosamine 2-epimerase (non-hydrolysing)
MSKKILLVAGTRPNFIKLAPLYHRLKEGDEFETFICHTGQHFDFNMSDVFWDNLELPAPDFNLNIQGDGVVDTIGKTILGINEIIRSRHFDLVVVFGDVNATAAGAIASVQTQLKVMHVEAGLRSFDRSMPEEINRIITDHISDFLMVSEPSGITNLGKEGFNKESYQLVGNIMIESLLKTKSKWEKIELPGNLDRVSMEHPVVITFHRPENVDQKDKLSRVADIIMALAKQNRIVFPVHPRTRSKLDQFGLLHKMDKEEAIVVTEPLGYFHFLKILSLSGLVVTDSGGVQEETSFLNIPCVTFRKNTERPITVDTGTNLMMDIWDNDFEDKITAHIQKIKNRSYRQIPLWDTEVSLRITDFIKERLKN